MNSPEQKRNTFVIQIIAQQNATWQGTVTWAERQITQNFRSALELVRLLDSAVSPELPLPAEDTAGENLEDILSERNG